MEDKESAEAPALFRYKQAQMRLRLMLAPHRRRVDIGVAAPLLRFTFLNVGKTREILRRLENGEVVEIIPARDSDVPPFTSSLEPFGIEVEIVRPQDYAS